MMQSVWCVQCTRNKSASKGGQAESWKKKKKKSAAEHSRQKVQKRTLIYILVAIGFAVAVVLSFALAGRWSTIFGWVGLGHFSQTAKDAPFSLHVLDVGKADAMVVSCQDKTIVIDGGTTDGGDTLTTYLQQMDVSQIDLVINTHPDNDHLQGLKASWRALYRQSNDCARLAAGFAAFYR